MGGHGGLNILPQKRWNVYNYDNREKVRRDEEVAAKEEQLKRAQERKRDTEHRLEKLRQARGLASSSASASASSQVAKASTESISTSDSKHINLFEGIAIFDPIKGRDAEAEEEKKKKSKKMKKEEKPRVVTAEDEKYRLGYGIAGKGVKLPWYMVKPSDNLNEEDDGNGGEKLKSGKKNGGRKTVEELREERLKREKREKERERTLLMEKTRRDGGFSRRG